MLALFLASFIGPGQVSPDLANNALSLYLARPFSRAEYVLGKMSILLVLHVADDLGSRACCSSCCRRTWKKAGPGCTTTAASPSGLFFGSWVWILMLSLLALALSAWVKWKPAAGALMFGVFFVAAGFGATINGVQRTNWGHLFNISSLIGSIWVHLFGARSGRQQRRRLLPHARAARNCRSGAAGRRWPCSACICLYMLTRKIRGAEVVR